MQINETIYTEQSSHEDGADHEDSVVKDERSKLWKLISAMSIITVPLQVFFDGSRTFVNKRLFCLTIIILMLCIPYTVYEILTFGKILQIIITQIPKDKAPMGSLDSSEEMMNLYLRVKHGGNCTY